MIMKIKKFLEKAAEEDRESQITEKDIEFLSSVGVDYNKKIEADKTEPNASYYLAASAFNYKTILITVACFMLIALVITLSLYFSLRPAPVTPPIQYFDDNFVSVDSDLQELNSDLLLFSLTADPDLYDVDIVKTYDSVSGDTLFYSLIFTSKVGLGKLFTLDIVVNGLYEHNELYYASEIKGAQLSGYALKYTEVSVSITGTPFYSVSCLGEIQIGEQWVYITDYEETALVQNPFITTLQAIINFN